MICVKLPCVTSRDGDELLSARESDPRYRAVATTSLIKPACGYLIRSRKDSSSSSVMQEVGSLVPRVEGRMEIGVLKTYEACGGMEYI